MNKVDNSEKPVVSAPTQKKIELRRTVFIVVIAVAVIAGGVIGYLVGRERAKQDFRDVLSATEQLESANEVAPNVADDTISILGIKITRTKDEEKNKQLISEALDKIDAEKLTSASLNELVQLYTVAGAAGKDELKVNIGEELKDRKSSLNSAEKKQVEALKIGE